VAALLAVRPPLEIERLYERSQELGAGRAPNQALLLADAIYGSLGATDLKPRLLLDRWNMWLAATAFRQLIGPGPTPEEPTATRFGTARIHASQLFLKSGLKFKLTEASRQLTDKVTS
jgi:hypothetical protein